MAFRVVTSDSGLRIMNIESLSLILSNDFLYCPRRAASLFERSLQIPVAMEHPQEPKAIRQDFVKQEIVAEGTHAPGTQLRHAKVRSQSAQVRHPDNKSAVDLKGSRKRT